MGCKGVYITRTCLHDDLYRKTKEKQACDNCFGKCFVNVPLKRKFYTIVSKNSEKALFNKSINFRPIPYRLHVHCKIIFIQIAIGHSGPFALLFAI